ncbi:pyridoxamine 5'-phosphate oxidase family protein [Amycolatopsis thermoflava]|uniref:pyridoxamine 5'-phosphate oxidase family protein n=1 Tax=Amycolatopsis thermoflava TaxID=84480 RepID=UPI00381B5157
MNQRAQITMTAVEIAEFVAASRTATIATLGADGTPHLVAMWFAVLDGTIWLETKAKSQKAVNLRRDPRITVLVEDGLTYDALRGVSIEGRGVVSEDPDEIWAVGVNVFERYYGPYSAELRPAVEMMLNKRVVVRVDPVRVRSWDHRKLGLDPMPLGGSTAP